MQKYPKQQNTGVLVAPGNYDGVHLGHQVLLRQSRDLSDRLGLSVRVLTFDPHPAALFAPGGAPAPLTTPQRRRELLLAHGADEVEIVNFDAAYAQQSPQAFVNGLLAKGAKAFVVGHDFRFGKQAAGDADLLRELASAHDAPVHVQGKVLNGADRISSTLIRGVLAAGDVTRAADLLGHVHDVTGMVEHGHKRGRTLGFPTANLRCESVMLPEDGVYAVWVRRLAEPRRLMAGVANLGSRPTFAAGRSVEVHLLGFDGELYGESLRVGFAQRLRGEQRFSSVGELKTQILRDCKAAAGLLTNGESGRLAWL